MIHASRSLHCIVFLSMVCATNAQGDSLVAPADTSLLLEPFELVHPAILRRATSTMAVDSALLSTFEGSGLRGALQFVPGVQMDERGHGGSMRLSIRGSVLRSPYGVRNVKVYWGPLPLTLADGSTPLELLDPLLIERLEVSRGVGHPRYGSAASGLLFAAPPLGAEDVDAFAQVIAGPDGYVRTAARAGIASDSNAISIGGLRQRNDGYRDQEWSARDQAFIATQWAKGRMRSQALFTWQHGSWALPGSVDSTTAIDDPTSARAYSRSINAHVDKRQVFGGIASSYELWPHTFVRTSAGANAIDKTNPYGTSAFASGHKEEKIAGLNARIAITGEFKLKKTRFTGEAGTEALWEKDALDERAFDGLAPDTLRTSAITHVRNVDLFASMRADLSHGWAISAAIGSEVTGYDHEDLLADTTLSIQRASRPLPMIAVEKDLLGTILHLRFAESTSRATVWELLGTKGRFNPELLPERWREVEFGAHNEGELTGVGMAAYYRRVDDLISEQQDSTGSVFANSGRARIFGVELHARAEGQVRGGWWMRFLLSAALQDGARFTGGPEEELPIAGLEQFQLAGLLRLQRDRGPYAEISGRSYVGVIANDRTDARMPDAVVFNLRIGKEFRIGKSRFEAFLHCENMMDQHYTAFVQVNDPGGRFYNPAPGRSFFGGVVWRFKS